MTSRLFWKLFLTFALLNFLGIAGVAWVGWNDRQFLMRLGWFPLLYFGFLLGSTWWVISSIIRPVSRLTKAAEKMADGEYDQPIHIGTQDELGQLAFAFNTMRHEMAGRLTEMRDTNQRLSTVLGGMTDGVIAINESREIQFANEAAGSMLGFVPAEAQGRTLLESVRSHKLNELVVRMLASKGHHEMEMEWGEENPRSLLVSATLLSDEPSAGIVIMIHNLSEVRRLEAMRRDFVANVSHELKTPLSSIKAYAETLSSGAINDEANRDRFVQQIEEQADRLNQLISDLLSLARIEQGNQLLDLHRIKVQGVVELCVREQRRAAESKNITLVTRPSEEPAYVEADEDSLRQIFINLVDNAIKYTPEGGQVIVSWKHQPGSAYGDESDSARHVAICVEDTGIGIPDDMQERVFERFFRVDKARSRELGGTGLGLAIVKHLAQSFGGGVSVKTRPEGGSCFTVRLPSP